MGLLESDPKLVENFTDLAYKFAELGYIAPMNVLWTYHFIGGRHDIATPLWQDYVQGCPQIMFQKVCQTARSSCNADLAQRYYNFFLSMFYGLKDLDCPPTSLKLSQFIFSD